MKSISCGYAYLHMNYVLHNYNVSRNSIERFQRSCADKLFQKYLSFWSNFWFQKGCNSEKKIWNQNFLWICASTHYVVHNYKVLRFKFCCTSVAQVALGVCFALKSWKEYLLLFTSLITLGKDVTLLLITKFKTNRPLSNLFVNRIPN